MCESTNDSDLDENLLLLPSEIMDLGIEVNSALLPGKSKKTYEKCYEKFMAWRVDNNMKSFSENVLLVYFQDMSKKFKASTLWTEYSMLKATLMINHQINIAHYLKLNAFLKRIGKGYKSKKSKTFLPHEIEEFLEKAPDQLYLYTKVALIFGIVGACRRHELHELKFTDVKDLNNAILVNISNSKPRKERMFTVKGKFYEMAKRYINLRPNPCESPKFFLRYSNGQCNSQNVGINSFGNMGKLIATYLNLPDPDSYTGHCFRRTSATISVVPGGDITSLEKLERWKGVTASDRSFNGTRLEASPSNSLKGSIPMKCTTATNQNVESDQNCAHVDQDWSKSEVINIGSVNWTDPGPQQILISVKTERTDNPSDVDPLSDSSSLIIYDSDESRSLADTEAVQVKIERAHSPHTENTNGECSFSNAASQVKTEKPSRPENTETEAACPASHTRLLEAILACAARQERAAERAARAQEAQARALGRIAQLLERGGRGGRT